nr:glutamine-hydrolyzing GMP synthase [Treponema sp.]
DGKENPKDAEELKLAQKELEEIKLDMFCEKCQAGLKRSILPVRSVGVQGDFRTYRFPALLTFAEEPVVETLETTTGHSGFYHFPDKREKIEACSSTITNAAKYINRTCIKLFQRPGLEDSALKIQEGYCNRRRLDQLREVDNIVLTELHASGWYDKIFQHLTIDLPYASTPDHATFVLRPVISEDVMTARFAMWPKELLQTIVHKIAELPFVDALYFDATNKPPATFGWE